MSERSSFIRVVLGIGVLVAGIAFFLLRNPDPAEEGVPPAVTRPAVPSFVASDAAPADPVAAPAEPAPAEAAPAAKLPPPKLEPKPPTEVAAKAAPPGEAKKAPSFLGAEHQGGEPAGDPAVVDRYLASHSPEELRLLGLLGRHNLDTPPQMQQLFDLQKRGASREQMVAFIQKEFPNNLQLRLLTAEWIDRQDPARKGQPPVNVKVGGRKPQGTIETAPARPVP